MSRRAAGKSLLRHLKQWFSDMPCTEFESLSFCVGCGAAMVTTDPTGAARAKGAGDLFFFFFFSNSFLSGREESFFGGSFINFFD
jgi:hypothetical protein